jgi:hypothetical protein
MVYLKGKLITGHSQVTMSGIFMPPRRSGEEMKKKWQSYRRKQVEENNNDS